MYIYICQLDLHAGFLALSPPQSTCKGTDRVFKGGGGPTESDRPVAATAVTRNHLKISQHLFNADRFGHKVT